MAGRPKGAHDIAPKVRAAFMKAVEKLRKGGTITDMSDIFEEMIAQDPFKAFDTLAKFVPKEMMIEQSTTHRFISGEPLSLDDWEAAHNVGEPIETLQ